MADSSIEWLHGWKTADGVPRKARVWNPTRGCKPVSPGCAHCYAAECAGSKFTNLAGPGRPYHGLVRLDGKRPHWTGDVAFDAAKLAEPLGWRAPSVVFVDSMSDLFYERFTDEQIAAVLGVMAACPQHVFIVLTKRAARMRRWFRWIQSVQDDPTWPCIRCAARAGVGIEQRHVDVARDRWPPPNVILGVSVEDGDQMHRVDDLAATPAACRLVSYEPALGLVDWRDVFRRRLGDGSMWSTWQRNQTPIDWLIVGGESGPDARPCDAAWLQSAVDQARGAGVPVFVKQLGTHLARARGLRIDRVGRELGNMPESLRVRELPRLG